MFYFAVMGRVEDGNGIEILESMERMEMGADF